jgi:thiamine-phosphate pyrophosphorylase
MFTLPRFYPILDTEACARRGLDIIQTAEFILSGGARILQFRHKGFYSREIVARMEEIAKLCADLKIPFVVNDRADLAAIFGAVLHLGQEDLTPTQARRVTGETCLIGFSTHNEAQLRGALPEPVDYLALGPMFGTASKQNPDPIVGLSELRRLRPLTKLPLVAIGGITMDNAAAVFDAGADSIAVIGGLFEHADIRKHTEAWVRLAG